MTNKRLLAYFSLVALVICIGTAHTACDGPSITLDPIDVDFKFGGFTIPAGIQVGDEISESFCDMISLSEIKDEVERQAGQWSKYVSVKSIRVKSVKVTALTGNFNFVQSVELFYTPAPVDGVEQTPITLGEAVSASGGFTDEISLDEEDVNLLTLIKDNDANDSEDCPEMGAWLTTSTPPDADVLTEVEFTASVVVVISL